MLPAVKRAPAAAALVAILAVTGCGGGVERSSRPDPREQISQAIEDLEDALGAHDYRRICERILSPEGRRRAGGEECERRLARTSAGVRGPEIELVAVTQERNASVAHVRAYAEGERPAIDVVRLAPFEGGYRVESLSGQ